MSRRFWSSIGLAVLMPVLAFAGGSSVIKDKVVQITVPDGWRHSVTSDDYCLGVVHFWAGTDNDKLTQQENFECWHHVKGSLPPKSLQEYADYSLHKRLPADAQVQPLKAIQVNGQDGLQTEGTWTYPIGSKRDVDNFHIIVTFTQDKTYYYCLEAWTNQNHFQDARKVLEGIVLSCKPL